MSKVAIVTDSTAYIPEPLLNEYSIHVAPQVLIWGEETFEDGVDILPSEFYKRLETADVMPSTSQVTPKSFEKIFSPACRKRFNRLFPGTFEIRTLLHSGIEFGIPAQVRG